LTDSTERWGDYTNIQRKYNTTGRAYLSGSWGKSRGVNCWVTIVDNKDFSVAVNDISAEVSNPLYPNPTDDLFNVDFNLDKEQKVRFEILDMNGRSVSLLMDTNVKAGNNRFSFSTQPLAAGNYMFTISTKEKAITTQKLTVR
jgi:hypothetical protein